ncbi:Tripartite ATP-independent transporter, DctQ component [Roseivivax lentus]|uniref:TRAP transporter small permease protein n=1 Tax=Roseivivax lentus TaxID=633194 RepID=A0A1N7JU34_9RHOB|nr:TRAP transporter small permease [Roseivivax lentus]SIS52872.1 Tripartite ATP-independent transporter, DctQ component [Roseivivax lentus]
MLALIDRLARFMALIGGVVLVALVILTCASVLGRGLNTLGHSAFLTGLAPGLAEALIAAGVGPITGDFELVEAGVAFAIFAFLPVCQLYSAHATVDVFTQMMPGRANRVLRTFWEVVLTLTIFLVTWRLAQGMFDKMRYGETTFLLQFPIWWAYALSLAGAVVASIVAAYCAGARVAGLITGGRFMPEEQRADH